MAGEGAQDRGVTGVHQQRGLGRAGHGDLRALRSERGVADARALLAHPLVAAAYFGAEDFIADMGGVRTAASQEVLYARSRVALAGRLAGVVLGFAGVASSPLTRSSHLAETLYGQAQVKLAAGKAE